MTDKKSEISSLGGFGSIEEIDERIQMREEELEEVFNDIDSLQTKNDNLHSKLSSLQTEYTTLLQQYKREEGLQKSLKMQRQAKTTPALDPSLIETEHYNFLKDKEDQNKKLLLDLESLRVKCEKQEGDLQSVHLFNSDTEQKIAHIERDTQLLIAKAKHINQELAVTRSTINQQKGDIGMYNKSINDMNDQVKSLVEKLEALESENTDVKNLNREIKLLKHDNQNLQQQVEESQTNIDNFQSNAGKELDNLHEKGSQTVQLVGWELERKSLTDELNQITSQESQIAQELDQAMKTNTMLKNRLNKLQPLHKKWISSVKNKSSQPVPEDDIDQLLSKCNRKGKKQMKTDDKYQKELENIIESNRKLEEKIAKKKDSLEIALNRFKIEESQLKQQIKQTRSHVFEVEHEIIEKINSVKLKIADKVDF